MTLDGRKGPSGLLDDVAVVIVHHNSLHSVFGTVDAILMQGVCPQAVTVVDNSDNAAVSIELFNGLPVGVRCISIPNRGYAAAVNFGIRSVEPGRYPFVLVSTHECRPEPGALEALRAAFNDGDPDLAIVGPSLRDAVAGGSWSKGGRLSRLGLPFHVHKETESDSGRSDGWLDGAFLLMRTQLAQAHPLDEDFGIYYEEIDHQRRLQLMGYGVRLVPAAHVDQSSGGIPPYWRARNAPMLARSHFGLASGVGAWVLTVTRLIGRSVVQRRLGDLAGVVRGAFAPRSNASVVIVNPLGGALKHYQDQLTSVLESAGHSCRSFVLDEPSVSGAGRLRYLACYAATLLRSRFAVSQGLAPAPILVLWPVLHYLDVPLVRLLAGRRAQLVMHDPRPLVRTRGSGPMSLKIASRLVRSWPLIAQSRVAEAHLRADIPPQRLKALRRLPLPILPPTRRSTSQEVVTVRALGRFKPDRDTDSMRLLAAELPNSWRFEVRGRGWPEIEGWQVRDEFMSEAEFDNCILTAAVVVIPYRRFYQSAVATRAIESCVPVSGPLDSSLVELYGEEAQSFLVSDPEVWPEMLATVVERDRQDVERIAVEYRANVVSAWGEWMTEFRQRERAKGVRK